MRSATDERALSFDDRAFALAGPLIHVFLTILILIVAPIVMKLQSSNV